MSDTWSFGLAKDSTQIYADGTTVPHRAQTVLLNGKPIGEIELHCHRRLGSDGKVDASFGITTVMFGPVPGGK